MATISKAQLCSENDSICQGDIFKDVKYSYVECEDDENVELIEYSFPYAIVISQACDVSWMNELMKNRSGKPAKFMPAVLMCPIYDKETAKRGDHLIPAMAELSLTVTPENIFKSEDLKIANRDWHYRLHLLSVTINNKSVLDNVAIDFKHYFTVPFSYLYHHKESRIMTLDSIYAEQISLKFSTFLSRVAIPD